MRQLAAAGDPYRRQWIEMWLHCHPIELVVPPVEVDIRSREEIHGGRQHLVRACATLRLVNSAGFELRTVPAGADAIDVAVPRQVLEGCNLLGQDCRRAHRQDEDR